MAKKKGHQKKRSNGRVQFRQYGYIVRRGKKKYIRDFWAKDKKTALRRIRQIEGKKAVITKSWATGRRKLMRVK